MILRILIGATLIVASSGVAFAQLYVVRELRVTQPTNGRSFTLRAGASTTQQNVTLPAAFPSVGQVLSVQSVSAPEITLEWAAPGGGGSTAFNNITFGTNTTAAMVVGAGSSLTPSGGTIRATEYTGTGSTTNQVDLGSAEVAGILPIVHGGTGSSTASGAITSLGIRSVSPSFLRLGADLGPGVGPYTALTLNLAANTTYAFTSLMSIAQSTGGSDSQIRWVLTAGNLTTLNAVAMTTNDNGTIAPVVITALNTWQTLVTEGNGNNVYIIQGELVTGAGAPTIEIQFQPTANNVTIRAGSNIKIF